MGKPGINYFRGIVTQFRIVAAINYFAGAAVGAAVSSGSGIRTGGSGGCGAHDHDHNMNMTQH